MQADFAVAVDSSEDESQSNATTSYKIDLQPPPFSDVHDGPEYLNTSVTIELNNNTRVKGKLLEFNAATETIGILEPRALQPSRIDMSSIKFMRLEMPYQLALKTSVAREESHPGIDVDTDARSFEVFFKDRTEITGKTFGTRNDKNGIHLYEQTKVGRKWRYCTHLFVSKTAMENHIIGGQIGDMLVPVRFLNDGPCKETIIDRNA